MSLRRDSGLLNTAETVADLLALLKLGSMHFIFHYDMATTLWGPGSEVCGLN